MCKTCLLYYFRAALKGLAFNASTIMCYISSIVNWGYRDNFKPVYFFCKKNLSIQKPPKFKTNGFHPLTSFCVCKNCCLCCFLFAYFCFCWLMFAFECFRTLKIFLLKKSKQAWNCLNSLNSLYYWRVPPSTGLLRPLFTCIYLYLWPSMGISFFSENLFKSFLFVRTLLNSFYF